MFWDDGGKRQTSVRKAKTNKCEKGKGHRCTEEIEEREQIEDRDGRVYMRTAQENVEI